MRRMLNHGTVSGTDVAGGIVGATYVVGASAVDANPTVVNINTAINYGAIEPISTDSYASIDGYLLQYGTAVGDYAYYFLTGATRTAYLWPTAADIIRREPGQKPGFGGVFGRLQRGTNGSMTPVGGSFDFVVNANPNVDLIGRIDQVFNYTASSTAYMFSTAFGKYYSARANDTTQVIFTGFYYAYSYLSNRVLVSGYQYSYTSTISKIYRIIGKTSVDVTPGTLPATYTVYLGPYNYNQSNWSNGNKYYYYAPVNIPWITEDPDATTNDATEWMYDPAFPMRTNTDLTKYIYFIPNELLADKFALEEIPVGTDNPLWRENGMYVLSTTAGSTYGLVLPSNLDTDRLREIDETSTTSPSLLEGYDNIDTDDLKDLDAQIEEDYNDLKQTKFNEKSALIDSDTTSFNLSEVGLNGAELVQGVINNTDKEVTFNISMEAFDSEQETASFIISQALTSANALIAKTATSFYSPSSPPTLPDKMTTLRSALYPYRNDEIATAEAIEASFQVTLPTDRTVTTPDVTIGYFTVYSEAFMGADLYAHSGYYTQYSIIVNFTPDIANSAGDLYITSVTFNGSSTSSGLTGPTDVISLGDVNYNGSILFTFTDTKEVLTEGYDFKDYISLYYGVEEVLPEYYTITSTPTTIIGTAGTYSVLLSFTTGILRTGNYTMNYQYFASSSPSSVVFDKAASSIKLITGLDYYSENDSTSIVNLAITSALNLGVTLDISGSTGNFTESEISTASYLSNKVYDVHYMTDNSFAISPFATLTSVALTNVTYTNGYKVYTITYIVSAENTSTSTYTHTITERTVDVTTVLKNGNEVTLSEITAAREDESTLFKVDLGFDQTLDLYKIDSFSYPYLSVFLTYTNAVPVVVTETAIDGVFSTIAGITCTTGDYLDVVMTDAALPGVYEFEFSYYRSATDIITMSTVMTITKLRGTDAYLKDIKFSEVLTEAVYPVIYICDTDGVKDDAAVADHNVSAYFGGIDYDGAVGNYFNFRVDGLLTNTPFYSYVPLMQDYLPPGATIARRFWNNGVWDYTDEVGADDDVDLLVTDFTKDPQTGVESDTVIIQYRISSEDGESFTYYYITVTDASFRVTLIFNIYYCTGDDIGTCSIGNVLNEFPDGMFIVSVKNYDTNIALGNTPIDDPVSYPLFSTVSLNNQMFQFYRVNTLNYRYSFGRNQAGYYVFDISLPMDQYMNPLYTYEIKYQTYTLYDASLRVAGLQGKYYYICASTMNRTRYFDIYIRKIANPSTSAPWGLFDFFRSWFD
jgi:hypothetical protein